MPPTQPFGDDHSLEHPADQIHLARQPLTAKPLAGKDNFHLPWIELPEFAFGWRQGIESKEIVVASALRKMALAAALSTAFAAAPAAATITLVSASDIQGENVLFNDGPLTGTTVVGHTNASTMVNFTGTTTDSNIIVGTGGQARLEGAPTGTGNNSFGLTSVDFSLASGTFNNLEFNLNSASAGAIVTFTAVDNNGDPFVFNNGGAGFTLGSGENFFGFLGIDNQTIASFSIDVTSGSLQDVRQIRLDGVSAVAAVPEPGTWAMMLVGFGAIGVGMRRRRRTGPTLMQAV